MDRSGKLLLTRAGISNTRAPALTDDGGQVVVQPERDQRWQLVEETPDRSHTIATLHSICKPRVSTISSSALFVVGCSPAGQWYRMLRLDGHTIILGKPSLSQIEQSAAASTDGSYAVRIVDLRGPTAGAAFRDADLHDERVAVHRGSDGLQLLLASVQSFPQASSNFALSPDGLQLALLTAAEVVFYRVESKGAPMSATRP